MTVCCSTPGYERAEAGTTYYPPREDCACACHIRPIPPSGRQRWLEHDSDSPWKSHAAEESAWHVCARIGEQSGTYFKTARTKNGMQVWRYGRFVAAEDAEVGGGKGGE